MKSSPTASILIPAKNAEDHIAESLNSVLSQDCEYSFEIVVVNDHSTDSTVEIVQRLMETNPNLRLLDNRIPGLSNALNFGVESTTADIIIRHDADDVMAPNRLQNQISFMKLNLQCAIYGGQINLITEDRSLRPNNYPLTDQEIRRFLMRGNPFAHPTVAINRAFLRKAGPYKPEFDGAEDYELWTRLLRYGGSTNSTEVFTNYRVHDKQVTKQKKIHVQKQTIRIQITLAKMMLNDKKILNTFFVYFVVGLRCIKMMMPR